VSFQRVVVDCVDVVVEDVVVDDVVVDVVDTRGCVSPRLVVIDPPPPVSVAVVPVVDVALSVTTAELAGSRLHAATTVNKKAVAAILAIFIEVSSDVSLSNRRARLARTMNTSSQRCSYG
jgi:hypothetical protein